MKTLIHDICAGVRVDELSDGSFTVIAPSSDKAGSLSRAFCDSGKVTAGREGHEYLRQLGLVQHVFALRPAGLFSNLSSLERAIVA